MLNRERAVLYTRVSTNKEEQKQSIDNQRDIYTQYCNVNNIELKKIYHDTKTGTNARRPGFKQMMYDAGLDYIADNKNVDLFVISDREPKFDFIIVKDTTRFIRNAELAISVVKRLRSKNVDILFENINLRASDENFDLIGIFFFKMGEIESSMIGKKIRQAKYYKAKVLKQYKPGRLPYGYTWDNERNIVIAPDQAKIIKYIFNTYSNMGSALLSKELNDKEIPTQNGYKWSSSKITRIIKNYIYTGTAVINKTFKKNVTDTKRVANEKDEFVFIPNAVPRIISDEQFEVANEILETRINKNGIKRGKKVGYTDVYFQKIYCAVCGNEFKKHSTIDKKKNNKTSYMCSSRMKQGRCGCRGISLNRLNKGLEEVEFDLLIETTNEQIQYSILIDSLKSELYLLGESKDNIKEQIEQLDETCEDLLHSIQENKEMGNILLEKDLERKYQKASQEKKDLIILQRKLKNIDKIKRLLRKVDQKKIILNELRLVETYNNEDKMKLLNKIVVSNYELQFYFFKTNYDDEIKEFNKIFPENTISNSYTGNSLITTVRRNHKEARVFWKQVDEDRINSEKA